jgi:hypothetical protein
MMMLLFELFIVALIIFDIIAIIIDGTVAE